MPRVNLPKLSDLPQTSKQKDEVARARPQNVTTDTSSNHIGFVLDASGSMTRFQYETIKGFNDYLKEVNETMREGTVFSMEIFPDMGDFDRDSSIFGGRDRYGSKTVASEQPVNMVLPLNKKTYTPDGGTPLYDTVNKMIDKVERWKGKRPNGQPIIAVQTDGQDTSSKMDVNRLRRRIQQKKEEGWIFILIGAGINAESLGQRMGIEKERCLEYSGAKTTMAFEALASITKKAANVEEGEPIFSIEDKRNLR